jgi:hypothetical protein
MLERGHFRLWLISSVTWAKPGGLIDGSESHDFQLSAKRPIISFGFVVLWKHALDP